MNAVIKNFLNRETNTEGCVFCQVDVENVATSLVSYELNCVVHRECLNETLEVEPDNYEARVIAKEYGIKIKR